MALMTASPAIHAARVNLIPKYLFCYGALSTSFLKKRSKKLLSALASAFAG
jgi:hypothetical protein